MGYKLNDKKENGVKKALTSLIALSLVFLLSQAIGRVMFNPKPTTPNNQISTSSAEQILEDECVKGIPDISSQMKSYCKCMSKKVIATYGAKKVSDMGLSMTQEQLMQEFTPLANQCISEQGLQI